MWLVWGKHTNNLLRKSPTSAVVDGPPMFIKTMAVGPLDEVASCVTGGTTVAIYLLEERLLQPVPTHAVGEAANWIREVGEARLEREATELRMASFEVRVAVPRTRQSKVRR